MTYENKLTQQQCANLIKAVANGKLPVAKCEFADEWKKRPHITTERGDSIIFDRDNLGPIQDVLSVTTPKGSQYMTEWYEEEQSVISMLDEQSIKDLHKIIDTKLPPMTVTVTEIYLVCVDGKPCGYANDASLKNPQFPAMPKEKFDYYGEKFWNREDAEKYAKRIESYIKEVKAINEKRSNN